MDTLKVVRRVPCVAAWKCPECGSFTASMSERVYWAHCDLDPDIGERVLKARLEQQTLEEARAAGRDYAGLMEAVREGEARQLRGIRLALVLPLAKVCCRKCGHVPAWCGGENYGSAAPVALGMLLGALLGGIVFLLLGADMLWLCFLLALGVGGGCAAGMALRDHMRVTRAEELREPAHMPLCLESAEEPLDEQDPRAAAIAEYLRQRLDAPLGHVVTSRIIRETTPVD